MTKIPQKHQDDQNTPKIIKIILKPLKQPKYPLNFFFFFFYQNASKITKMIKITMKPLK
jgi:hypothetical protein